MEPLKSNEVEMNEQHAGRHLMSPAVRGYNARTLTTSQQVILADCGCPACGHVGRHLRMFNKWAGGDPAPYAVCANCGHWQRI